MSVVELLVWLGAGAGNAAVALLLKVTLVVGLTALLAWLLRGSSASARHLTWFAGLSGSLLLTVLQQLLPSWDLFLPGLTAAERPGLLQTSAGLTAAGVSRLEGGVHDGRGGMRTSLASIALVIWIAGAVLLFLRVLAGSFAARRLIRRSSAIREARTVEALALASRALGIRRHVQLGLAPAGDAPATSGIFTPWILLPAESRDWPADRLRIVLLHESAHVARNDCATLIMAECARAALWVHPGVWWALRRLREERELACDELVLAQGVRRHRYAEELLEITRLYAPARAAAALSMASRSRLEGRLRAILEVPARRASAGRRRLLRFSLVLALAATLPLGTARPAVRRGAQEPPPTAPLETAAPAQERRPELWGSGHDPATGRPRLSCWGMRGRDAHPTLTFLFAGTLRGATWLRLMPTEASTQEMGAALVASAAGDLRCSSERGVGLGMAGVWGEDDVVALGYSPGARVLLEAPPGRVHEISLPTSEKPLLCLLSARRGEYGLSCRGVGNGER